MIVPLNWFSCQTIHLMHDIQNENENEDLLTANMYSMTRESDS